MSNPDPSHRSVWAYLMEAPFRQDYIEAGGLRTRYVQAGKVDAPPLVLLHGTGGHWETFCANLGVLAKTYNCLAFDMLGCGFTDKPDKPYEIADYLDHALAVLDVMHIARASFIGVSLGSWVLAKLAASHPDRVDKLILLAPPGLLPFSPSTSGTADVRRSAASDPSWENISNVLKDLFFDEKSLMDDLVSIRQRVYSAPDIDKIMPRMLTLFDPVVRARNNLTQDEWRRIVAPTLIIAHVDKQDYWLKSAYAIHELMQNSRIVEFHKTSHWSHFEDPERFNEVALDFLKN